MNPDKYTNQELYVDVGDGHSLYVQDWGNENAELPIMALHGGPGGGFGDRHRQRFNPETQRVIFHDQRGAGKSRPYGSLEHNTTDDLVEDIEKIAGKLALEKFILTGGSWGSTLALAYALKHPERVSSMILQGIFTGSQEEVDYINQGAFRTHFPDVWQEFVETVPEAYRRDPSAYHLERMLGSDATAALESTKQYNRMEGALVSLDDRFVQPEDEEFDPVPTKIECHYTSNTCFMPDRYILDNAHNLAVPVWLVQGRYDFICVPAIAHELHAKLPNSQLIWTQAGHGNDRNNYEVMRSLLLQASI